MPVIKSAIKKLKQSLKHQSHNRATKRTVRDLVEAFKKSPSVKAYNEAVSALDKAAKTNVIHKNKASRLKSRLSKRLPKVAVKKSPIKKTPTKKTVAKKSSKKS